MSSTARFRRLSPAQTPRAMAPHALPARRCCKRRTCGHLPLDADERFQLGELAWTDAGDVLKIVGRLKRSVGLAVFDDAPGETRTDTRQLREFGFARGIDVERLTFMKLVRSAARGVMTPAAACRPIHGC